MPAQESVDEPPRGEPLGFGGLLVIFIVLLIAINILAQPLTGKLLAQWFEEWGVPLFVSWVIAFVLAGLAWILLRWSGRRHPRKPVPPKS